jgi:hypothetical protein
MDSYRRHMQVTHGMTATEMKPQEIESGLGLDFLESSGLGEEKDLDDVVEDELELVEKLSNFPDGKLVITQPQVPPNSSV